MIEREKSSFRDNSGFIFRENGKLRRQVNLCYKQDYDALMTSGLYDKLVEKGWLVAHKELSSQTKDAYKILEPDEVDFITYPYEWSFSAYKDAALLTLKIQKQALLHGMTLKDASSYNVQFQDGLPVFIDTLSFQKLDEKEPWQAYKQFCQHFLVPLALMSYKDDRLSCLMKNYIDGIPLDMASKLLPKWSSLGLMAHIHLNASFQDKYSSSQKSGKSVRSMSLKRHIILIENLFEFVSGLKNKFRKTEWGKYYTFTNYNQEAFVQKGNIIREMLLKVPSVKTLWDMGANDGYFTRLASGGKIKTVAFDIDPMAVEFNYLKMKKEKETNILPLVFDLFNPSPAIGWANVERPTIQERGTPDVVMALALIHHLCISNNTPIEYVADYFREIAPYLVIEFVGKEDSQVKKLLSSREDIFDDYTEEGFEKSFSKYFKILEKRPVSEMKRTLYLMKRT